MPARAPQSLPLSEVKALEPPIRERRRREMS